MSRSHSKWSALTHTFTSSAHSLISPSRIDEQPHVSTHGGTVWSNGHTKCAHTSSHLFPSQLFTGQLSPVLFLILQTLPSDHPHPARWLVIVAGHRGLHPWLESLSSSLLSSRLFQQLSSQLSSRLSFPVWFPLCFPLCFPLLLCFSCGILFCFSLG